MTTSGRDSEPAWSPNGDKIVFHSGQDGPGLEIYIMNTDGTGQARLTNDIFTGDAAPVFSPDGTQIVFHSDRSGGFEILVMNSDGSGITQLTTTDYNVQPHWSPSGEQIVFESLRDTPLPLGHYVMDSDGSSQTRITNNSTVENNAAWRSGPGPAACSKVSIMAWSLPL